MSGSPSKEGVEPKQLDLSVNPEDGSLLTAPLLTVLLASTDGLYTDLSNAANGELDVTTAAQQGEGDEDDAGVVSAATTKKERLSNLSFAQRRHELAWRLVQHGKGLTHVAALTAANASTDFSNATQVSTRALQHARTAWVQADEAQDALYFFHAQLFPARQSPHDVYGALDLQLIGKWLDMPTDLRLTVDRFHSSREARWSAGEISMRWQMAVRNKLLKGEVAWMKQQKLAKPLWNVSLKGGIVRLTHGKPKKFVNQPPQYPIEALLTVLTTSTPSEWSLLSIEVRSQPKTGESNHQLEASNRQRYNLHRLCALAMAKEEARARRLRETAKSTRTTSSAAVAAKEDKAGDTKSDDMAAMFAAHDGGTLPDVLSRPLSKLFSVAHCFSLSWQLEILSAQAQALKRGNWASGGRQPIVVTPVQFLEPNSSNTDKNNGGAGSAKSGSRESAIIGIVSISFWRVDDQYGPPYMGDLFLGDEGPNNNNQPADESSLATAPASKEITPPVTNQLTLSFRAETNVGVCISLSGGMPTRRDDPHIQGTLKELLDAASNPFALSASGALLAATRLCSEQKCHAIVQALQPAGAPSCLPSWLYLTVERTSIAVFARITYNGIPQNDESPMVGLFRLTCDARTGGFVCTFSRSTHLLRRLACNDMHSSESTTLRILSLPQRRRRVAGANTMGRVVRDALDGLTRSMNALSYRTGVGGVWKDRDHMSAKLRLRAIQAACGDASVALIKACGISAMYGLSCLALGVATGVTITHDM